MRALQNAMNFLYPPQCLSCEGLVPTHGTLCQPCWSGLHFITTPMCAKCGFPFSIHIGEGAYCAACIESPPLFGLARTILVFDEASKTLVHKLKFQDETYLSHILSQWMLQFGAELIQRADVVVPVPLNRWRLLKRRYNQSALLAQIIARKSSKACKPELLVRVKKTLPQTGLSKNEREENVRSAFVVPETFHAALSGKRVLLIDDVLTTGATVNACIKALLKGGASEVDVLTLTRVARVT